MSRRHLFFIFLGILALALWEEKKYVPRPTPKSGSDLADYVAYQSIRKHLNYYISIYEKIVAQNPTNSEAKKHLGKLHRELGEAALKAGEEEAAQKHLEAAQKLLFGEG